MDESMKRKGFTFTETVISVALFIVAILPLIELNKELLKTERRYEAIEHSRKNSEVLEKQFRGQGYDKLKSRIGSYTYELKEGEKELALLGFELPFPAGKNEKFQVNIQLLNLISDLDKENIIYVETIYYGVYKNFKTERVVTEYEKYYTER